MNDRELQQRLETLGRSVPASDGFTRAVMGRVAAGEAVTEPRNLKITRWVMRGAIGVAACVVVGVFAWALLVGEPQRVYGMPEVARRLAGARSVYIAGHMDGEGGAFAMYADRAAGRAWRTSGADVTVAVDGTRRVVRDNQAKTWTVSPVAAVDARLTAEMILQMDIMGDLLAVGRDEFRKVRSERVAGVMADVYEGRHKAGNVSVRVEVAVDPRAGTALRAEIYFVGAFGWKKDLHVGTVDRIEVDGPPPAGAFDAAAPAGFATKRMEAGAGGEGPAEWSATSSSGSVVGNRQAARFRMRYAFVLPGRAGVLMCWALYDPLRPEKDLALPGSAGVRMSVNGDGGYDLRTFRTDETAEGYHWRWSAAVPRGGGPVGAAGASVDVTSATDEYHLVIPALEFPREELGRLFREAQRVTMAARGEPMALEEIERVAKGAAEPGPAGRR